MKKEFLTNSLIQGLIHLAAIAGGYGLAALFSTEDRFTYGTISGWWLSLYVGFVFNVRWPAIVSFSILYIVVLLFDISLNTGWFYLEGASSDRISYFLLSLIGLVMFVVPILINETIRRFTKNQRVD